MTAPPYQQLVAVDVPLDGFGDGSLVPIIEAWGAGDDEEGVPDGARRAVEGRAPDGSFMAAAAEDAAVVEAQKAQAPERSRPTSRSSLRVRRRSGTSTTATTAACSGATTTT